jgi:hypothetical protein
MVGVSQCPAPLNRLSRRKELWVFPGRKLFEFVNVSLENGVFGACPSAELHDKRTRVLQEISFVNLASCDRTFCIFSDRFGIPDAQISRIVERFSLPFR